MSIPTTREIGTVVVPLAGAPGEARLLDRAGRIATDFGARLVALHVPPDPTQLTPWIGETHIAGLPSLAMESLVDATEAGRRQARADMETCGHADRTLLLSEPPAWSAVADACRLADLVVFEAEAARGAGPLAVLFEQVLMEERAATLVLRTDTLQGPALVAWDGGEPASRAARRAVPLLRRAQGITVVTVRTGEGAADPARLVDYYGRRGIDAEALSLEAGSDIAETVLGQARAMGAGLMVAGAFGRSRLRAFVFGGSTQSLLRAEAPNLFVAH